MQPDLLRRVLSYDKENGLLFWKPRTPDLFEDGKHSADHTCAKWNARYAGNQAFTSIGKRGYPQTSCLGKVITAHRAAWAIVTGKFPRLIDHINGDKTDNRWINLRSVSQSENMRNARYAHDGSSDCLGVSWDKRSQLWRVRIGRSEVGRFKALQEAIKARKSREKSAGFGPNYGYMEAAE